MGGHGIPHTKTKYFSIDDIPDSLVTKQPRRDPENPFYRTRRWVNFKKRQILFTQNDGVQPHLRTPARKLFYYGLWANTLGLTFYGIYLINFYCLKKKTN